MIKFEVVTTKSEAKEQAIETRQWLADFIAALPPEAEIDMSKNPDDDAIADAVRGMQDVSGFHNTFLRYGVHKLKDYAPNFVTYGVNWGPGWSAAADDVTGQIFNAGVSKYCNAITRYVFEQKQAGTDFGDELAQVDWTWAAEHMVRSYVQEGNILRINNVSFCRFFKDGDVFIGGFFTEQDRRRLRYSHKRLGAHLASLGYTDEEVRTYVENQKVAAAGSRFIVYPNDRLFGPVYVQGRDNVDSCMSGPADNYDSYDTCGVHPVDVYSSAWFGSGDNRLALITSVDTEGEIIGRGILNTARKQIVRWYGDHVGLRSLRKVGLVVNTCAMQGSWLALVSNDKVFVHPYVDGDYGHGSINHSEGRVYITEDEDDAEIQGTEGVSYLGGRIWSEYHDTYIPRDSATHVEMQDVMVHEDRVADLETCYIWDEPCVSGEQTVLLISADDYNSIGTENEDGDEITLDDVDSEEVIICGNVWYRLFRQGLSENGYTGVSIEGQDVIYY